MANWETASSASSYNNLDALNTQITGRQRTEDGGGRLESFGEIGAYQDAVSAVPDFWSFVKGIKEYSVVGIDGSQIPTMAEAIETYVANVQKVLESAVAATAETVKGGFRGGDVETEVVAYMDKVRDYIYNLVSSLNLFVDKLNDVGNAWITAQASFGSSVKSSAGAFSSGTAYVAGSEVQYSGTVKE